MRAATIAGCVETICEISLTHALADSSLKRALADVRIFQARLQRADVPSVPRCTPQPSQRAQAPSLVPSWWRAGLPYSRKLTPAKPRAIVNNALKGIR